MTVEQCKEKIKQIEQKTKDSKIVLICLEELTELQKAIIKLEREEFEFEHEREKLIIDLQEEMADVYIIIEHLKNRFKITDENLQEMIEFKINRTLELIK